MGRPRQPGAAARATWTPCAVTPRQADVAVDPDDALGNYFEGRDGRFYCYHFAFYPLLTLPARWLCASWAGTC